MNMPATNHGPDVAFLGERNSKFAIIVLCFLIVLLDGFDTISITFVAPTLAGIWGLPVSAMAPAFLATSLGAVIGYICVGPLALRLGERKVMLTSVALFGLGTLATSLATDIASLSLFRLFTSIGLGAVLPLAIGGASSVVSPERRATTAILIATGLSAGGVLAGMVGGALIKNYGWVSVFVVGGILPLLLVPAIYHYFPEASVKSSAGHERSPILGLFEGRLAFQTVLLWLFAFTIFVEAYALLYWTPTLLINWGMPKELAPASAAAYSMGGLVGGVLLIFLVSRLGVLKSLFLFTVFGLGCIQFFGLGELRQEILMPIVFGLGLGLLSCCVGQSALAVSFYPPRLRTTGIGCAAAAGRVGSIVGPALGGAVIALEWTSQQVVLAAAIPSVAALAILLATHLLVPREPAEIRSAAGA